MNGTAAAWPLLLLLLLLLRFYHYYYTTTDDEYNATHYKHIKAKTTLNDD